MMVGRSQGRSRSDFRQIVRHRGHPRHRWPGSPAAGLSCLAPYDGSSWPAINVDLRAAQQVIDEAAEHAHLATQALLVPQASFGHGGDACTKMVLTPSDSRERSRPASFGKIARLKVGIDRSSEAAVNNPQSSLTLESIPASRFFQEGLVQSVIYAGVSAVLCLAGC